MLDFDAIVVAYGLYHSLFHTKPKNDAVPTEIHSSIFTHFCFNKIEAWKQLKIHDQYSYGKTREIINNTGYSKLVVASVFVCVIEFELLIVSSVFVFVFVFVFLFLLLVMFIRRHDLVFLELRLLLILLLLLLLLLLLSLSLSLLLMLMLIIELAVIMIIIIRVIMTTSTRTKNV